VALFDWDTFTLLFWCTIGRCSIGWLWLGAVLLVLSCAFLLVTTFLLVHCPALLVWDLLAVVEVERATLFSGYDFTIVTCRFCVKRFFLSITFLTLLSFHVSVFLYVDLPAFLVWNFYAGCLRFFVAF